MVYLKNILVIILLTIVFNIQGQQILSPNFVQNPSFEQYDTCPNSSGQLNLSKHWWGASTEYYNSCYPIGGGSGVPDNYDGFQYAHTGVAYSGFVLYAHSSSMSNNDTYVETIKNILNDSLKRNKRYCTNYYVSLAEWTYWAAQTANSIIVYDSIGVMFSVNQVQDNVSMILCDTCTKFAKSIANIDTVNWFKISGSVIANGGEQYLSIGKFNIMNWTPNLYPDFYVYVDDVSVCECSFKFNLGNDTTLCNEQSLILNPNMPNATYTWQDGSHANTYNVTQAGTYYVSAYFSDYNITTTDTIVINYINCDTVQTIIPDIYIPKAFTPNGNGLNDVFKVVSLFEFSEFKLSIFNRWGEMVFDSEDINKGWDGTFKGKLVPKGVYIYQLTATIKDTGEQRKITGRVTVIR